MSILYPVLDDFFTEICNECKVADLSNPGSFLSINYEQGKDSQIIESLIKLDSSETLKGLKYPLVAVKYPVSETPDEVFKTVRIQKLVIAYMTRTNTGSEPVKKKYNSDGVFKTVLYPLYYEILKHIARSRWTRIGDPEVISHTKVDNPSTNQISNEVVDFVDIVEITNLEIKFNQIKNC